MASAMHKQTHVYKMNKFPTANRSWPASCSTWASTQRMTIANYRFRLQSVALRLQQLTTLASRRQSCLALSDTESNRKSLYIVF